MPPYQSLREHVLYLLRGGGAHLSFDAAVADLPAALRGVRPSGLPHTPWRLVEHMRLCQRDILEFSTNPDYREPAWPDDYWPAGDGPPATAGLRPEAAAWDAAIDQFRRDLAAMADLVADPATDLLAPIAWGDGQTILREALLAADHNAYHLGQLVTVRRLLGAWRD